MYKLHIDEKDVWDEDKEEFFNIKGFDGYLEHSLLSISKWEAKYKKPYITSEKTVDEALDYIRMMVVGEEMEDENTVLLLTNEQIEDIGKYINDPMTATVFSKEDEKAIRNTNANKFVTSEEIYYWMTAENIPFECEKWHLNRLITLVRICAIKNKPDDKKNKRMTSAELATRRAQMEAARKRFKAK